MNFFRTLISLCSSFNSYRAVRDLPITDSLKYLIFLMAGLGAILLASVIPVAMDYGDRFAHWMDDHVTPFSIEDGRVISNLEQPYRVGDTNFSFVVDTTGKTVTPDPLALRGMLFTADSLTVWTRLGPQANAPVYSPRQSLRGLPNGVVNGEYFRKLIRSSLWVGLPFAWLVAVLIGSLTTMLQAYLFTLVASSMERGVPGPLQFHQLLNIAIHSVTPAAIIVTAYLAMRLTGLNLWLIYLIAYGVFLIGATNACRDVVPGEEKEDDLL